MTPGALTLGTAGHIDHGKTALVRALTGVDTDRLPQERERGISIELGYASMRLGDRPVSVVDVPGHERFVRTMVAGATGIDLFLMVIAADDGVMPQTREHATVLRGLGIARGVVAVTKADVAEPDLALAEAAELFPGVEAVACSGRTGEGVEDVRAALERVAAELPGRWTGGGEPVLHVDRAFTIRGAGTVVTGTLWAGAIGRGDRLVLLPSGVEARVRGVQVHDAAVERAQAGQRVAVNLAGVDLDEVRRGDVLAGAGAGLEPSYVLDARLDPAGRDTPRRVHVHHGTREAPARLVPLGGGELYQLRVERPLLARRGDRVVIRSVAPPDTLGGGVVLDPRARRHGASAAVRERLERLARGEEPEPAAEPPAPTPAPPGTEAPPELPPAALALEQRLRAAGHEPPSEAELGDGAAELEALRAAGRAVRVGRNLWAHPDALEDVRERVVAVCEAEGAITLARLRDELQTSRKFAQALLEHLDAARVTLRRPDDTRVLRRRRAEG